MAEKKAFQHSLDLGELFLEQPRQLIVPAKPADVMALKLAIGVEEVVDLAAEDAPRPGIMGNPRDLSTCPSLPKPAAYIQIVDDGALRLEERKLFNVLLAESWERLADPRLPGPFSAPAVRLRRAIGQATQRGNGRLRESLDRLLTTRVRFPTVLKNGELAEASTTLISHRALSPSDGMAEWDFHPPLRPYLAQPGQWARLHLHICARFRSMYALVLYEHLSLIVNRSFPIWNESVENLRARLGASDRLPYWSDFENKALRRALDEINSISDLAVEFEPLREGAGRDIERVRFSVKRREQ